eukprot:170068-Amorphochlora_amoeboformis.AAC.1
MIPHLPTMSIDMKENPVRVVTFTALGFERSVLKLRCVCVGLCGRFAAFVGVRAGSGLGW